MADAGYLTIGKVVKRLQAEYPDLSVSKIRYLEDEGLLTPSRTPGGYRLYSTRDMKRLETILYLQKNRFMPLNVIKEELGNKKQSVDSASYNSMEAYAEISLEDEVDISKMHPIENIPDLIGVSVAFVRSLVSIGMISLHMSQKGRELVDGADLHLIKCAFSLSKFGIEPKNLRQYVNAANRESTMFEQALTAYLPRSNQKMTLDQKEAFTRAFNQIISLTDVIRTTLIERAFKDILHVSAGKEQN